MSNPTPQPRYDYGPDSDYWIDLEFGPPSLASVLARIAAFRKNPNHRSAYVTRAQLARVLDPHPPGAWPEDIVRYLLDLNTGRLPRARGRAPEDIWRPEACAFLRDEYRRRRLILEQMRAAGTLKAWAAARGHDARTSLSEMAINSVWREYRLPMSERRLLNIFSELERDHFRE